MTDDTATYTVFSGVRRIASGDQATAIRALQIASEAGQERLVAFEDATGRQVDFDLRGGAAASGPARQGRGRPKLGVVAREVTLLPRHWDWLSAQPGGASAALRRLVDQARKVNLAADEARAAQEAAYRVMTALAGDLPRFEEAVRALYGGDLDGVGRIVSTWPNDIAAYVTARIGALRAANTGS